MMLVMPYRSITYPALDRRPASATAALLVHVVLFCTLLVPGVVEAKAHLWRISEIFSNADGTVQFIELHECCGSLNEYNLTATTLTSDANVYAFPANLPFIASTANGWVLIATADFAALPGAPTPDYIIPANFFDPNGDTITYVGGPDTAVLAVGALPTDGLHAFARDITSGALTVAVNSPTNFPGVSGSVSPPPPVPLAAPWLLGSVLACAGLFAARRFAGGLR